MSFKNIFKTFLLISLFLFVGSNVIALEQPESVDYSRTPTGTFIKSPIHMEVSFTDFEEFCSTSPLTQADWKVRVWDLPDWINFYDTEVIASTTKSAVFDLALPISEYVAINPVCFTGGTWSDSGFYFEYIDDYATIFEIITYTYLPLSSTFASSTLAYAGQLFTDLSLVVYLTIGLPLGFWIIKKIISLVKAR